MGIVGACLDTPCSSIESELSWWLVVAAGIYGDYASLRRKGKRRIEDLVLKL